MCKRTCKVEDCVCMQSKLKCTSLCTPKCDNMVKDEHSIVLPETEEEEEEEEFDEDIETSDIQEDF